MMVERSPYVENAGQLIQDLEKATTHLEKISQKPQDISKQELDDLIHALSHFNENLDPSFWGEKKLALEGISEKIEKALIASQLFQRISPEKDRSGQRNVDQQIVSLSSALTAALNTFDKNLRDLKKHKIGVKVEKASESKRY